MRVEKNLIIETKKNILKNASYYKKYSTLETTFVSVKQCVLYVKTINLKTKKIH